MSLNIYLNPIHLTDSLINQHKVTLKSKRPNVVVIDDLFDLKIIDKLVMDLKAPQHWQSQKHTYQALYASEQQWQNADVDERFVLRDIWAPKSISHRTIESSRPNNTASQFLSFVRSKAFLAYLSRIFGVHLSDINLAQPEINSNYFRLGANDFVKPHADESPGREVCMLVYLNKDWPSDAGGELVFAGNNNEAISILPSYNRCVLFKPSSRGSEHWVNAINKHYGPRYRYNLTSWYWSE